MNNFTSEYIRISLFNNISKKKKKRFLLSYPSVKFTGKLFISSSSFTKESKDQFVSPASLCRICLYSSVSIGGSVLNPSPSLFMM